MVAERHDKRQRGQSSPVSAGGSRQGKRPLATSAPVQARPAPILRMPMSPDGVREAAQRGVQTPASQLPFADAIQRSFGPHDVSQMQAHLGAEASASAAAMNATAFATGQHVVFNGQPDLQTAAHEAAHVVQQRSGVHLAGGIGREGDRYERNADAVAARVVAGQPASDLLDQGGPGQGGQSGGQPVQFRGPGPVTWDEFEQMSNDAVKWQPHKTQENGTGMNKLLPGRLARGYGVVVRGTRQAPGDWKSFINPKGPNGTYSLGVEALLGPDFAEGKDVPLPEPYAQLLEQIAQAATGGLTMPQPYWAQTIVPAFLGGDGSKESHIVVLPADAAGQLSEVHNKLIKLVNRAMGWVWLEADVTYAQADAHNFYANNLEIRYWEVDENAQVVSGTGSQVKLTVPSPSRNAVGDSSTAEKPDRFNGHDNKARVDEQSLRRDQATAVRWRTQIHFGPTDPATGDGTLMYAAALGPDHKIGEEPVDGIWKSRTSELSRASGGGTYFAGHLLNHHIGGPGNDARNLAPIPHDANDEHEDKVEKPIKKIVNQQLGWVNYQVRVVHSQDPSANVRYPSALECTWYQLQPDGEMVPGTWGAVTIKIKAPSDYNTSASTPDSTGSDPGAAALDTTHTATSVMGYDEVVLEDKDTLKAQRPVMVNLVKKIRQLGLNRYFAQDPYLAESVEQVIAQFRPGPTEVTARETIELVNMHLYFVDDTNLEALNNRLPMLEKELGEALTVIKSQSESRHSNALAALQSRYQKRYENDRADLIHKVLVEASTDDQNNLFELVSLSENLVQFAKAAIQNAEEVHYYATAPSSPGTVQETGRAILGSPMSTPHETRMRLVEHAYKHGPGATSKKRKTYDETPSVGGAQRMIKQLDGRKALPPFPKRSENVVARTIELLAPHLASDREMVEINLDSLYHQQYDLFMEYLNWLEKQA